jgi:hypothetical protein
MGLPTGTALGPYRLVSAPGKKRKRSNKTDAAGEIRPDFGDHRCRRADAIARWARRWLATLARVRGDAEAAEAGDRDAALERESAAPALARCAPA